MLGLVQPNAALRERPKVRPFEPREFERINREKLPGRALLALSKRA